MDADMLPRRAGIRLRCAFSTNDKGDDKPVTFTPTVEYESLRDDKSTFYYYKKTLFISLILSFLILAPL